MFRVGKDAATADGWHAQWARWKKGNIKNAYKKGGIYKNSPFFAAAGMRVPRNNQTHFLGTSRATKCRYLSCWLNVCSVLMLTESHVHAPGFNRGILMRLEPKLKTATIAFS